MANPPPPQMKKVTKPLASWRAATAKAIPWLLATYLCGLVIQVLLAGYGLMEVGGQGMDLHLTFARLIEFLPLVILIVGFVGGDKWTGIMGIALVVLFQLQYVFISMEEPIVRALHPTNAVLMFGLTLGLLLKRPLWHHAQA